MSCSEEGKALKSECVVLGPGDRELIMDYLTDRDDVFEGDDENEDELRDEDSSSCHFRGVPGVSSDWLRASSLRLSLTDYGLWAAIYTLIRQCAIC